MKKIVTAAVFLLGVMYCSSASRDDDDDIIFDESAEGPLEVSAYSSPSRASGRSTTVDSPYRSASRKSTDSGVARRSSGLSTEDVLRIPVKKKSEKQKKAKQPIIVVEEEEDASEALAQLAVKDIPFTGFAPRVSRWFNASEIQQALDEYVDSPHEKQQKFVDRLLRDYADNLEVVKAYVARSHSAPRGIFKLLKDQRISYQVVQKTADSMKIIIPMWTCFNHYTQREQGKFEISLNSEGSCYHWHFHPEQVVVDDQKFLIQDAGAKGQRIQKNITEKPHRPIRWQMMNEEDLGLFVEDEEQQSITTWMPGSDTYYTVPMAAHP